MPIYSNHGRIVVDSAAPGKKFLSFDSRNGAYYPVYYVGKHTDTLFLGPQPISEYTNDALEKRYETATNWKSLNGMELEIFVDTTMNLGYDIRYSHFSADIQEAVVDSTSSIKAFAIFITNRSDSLVMLGTHNFVRYLTREVQDQNGNWVEVEHHQTDLCGTYKRSLVLEPGHVMVAKVLRYDGDFKIPCRLKLSMTFGDLTYRAYSNVFEDYFDLSKAR